MKRWMRLCALLAGIAMLAACCAMAEDDANICWTTREEAHYHLDAACGNSSVVRYPLSVEAALAFEKQPCPVCAAGEAGPEPELPSLRAAERGGTWVIRVPGEVLEHIRMQAPEREASMYSLSTMYARTLSGASELRYAVPESGGLFMSLRSVGGDCCVVVRPTEPYSEGNPFRWEARELSLDFFNDADPRQTGVSEPLESVLQISDEGYVQVFSAAYAQSDIAVYRTMDLNIAVLHWAGGDMGDLCMAYIGELPGVPVQGYFSQGQFVYCWVITDAELGALVAGAVPEVTYLALSADGAAPDDAAEVENEVLPDLSGDALADGVPDSGEGGVREISTSGLPEGWSNTFFD